MIMYLLNAYDNVLLNAYDNVLLNAYENVLLNAYENVLLNAYDNVLINAYDNVLLNTFGTKAARHRRVIPKLSVKISICSKHNSAIESISSDPTLSSDDVTCGSHEPCINVT